MPRCALAVDDEESNLAFLGAVLRKNGFRTMLAASSEQALRLCEEPGANVDLVISDIKLPGTSGVAMAVLMATRFELMRFLFVSGSPTEGWDKSDIAALEALSSNKYCFLPKPFTVQSLEECLHCIFSGFGKRSTCVKHGLDRLPVHIDIPQETQK